MKGQVELTEDCSANISQQSQFQCQWPPTFSLQTSVLPSPVPHHPSPGAIILLDKLKTLPCISSFHSPPSSPLSTIIWCVQSLHPKIKNSSRLNLTQTLSVLYVGLMIKTQKVDLKASLWPCSPALLPPAPPTLSSSPTAATLVYFHSLERAKSLSTSEILHTSFPLPGN